MQTLYITHPSCRLHEMGDWHPECPQRLEAINDQLIASGLLGFLDEVSAVPATMNQVLRVHDSQYVNYLQACVPESGYFFIDPDTGMNTHTMQAAWAAAGAGITAVDAIMAGKATTAFCSVRPPGHHAGRGNAMGFCFFNNLAIAVAHVLAQYGLARIAIVDFDVHHGNGTEACFRADNRVLMCSFFQHPFFPGGGIDAQAPNMANVPVAAYTCGPEIRQIVSDVWLPRLALFKPEFIFVSAGFDAHRDDDMGQLGMVESDYAWITRQIMAQADATAQGRVVSFLEGGYELGALGRSVVAHVKALAKL